MNVYILRAGNHFKVGVAADIKTRIRQIQTGNPYPVELLASLRTRQATKTERAIHRDLSVCRCAGEWFTLTRAQFDTLVQTYGFTVVADIAGWISTPVERQLESQYHAAASALESRHAGEVARLNAEYEHFMQLGQPLENPLVDQFINEEVERRVLAYEKQNRKGSVLPPEITKEVFDSYERGLKEQFEKEKAKLITHYESQIGVLKKQLATLQRQA